jgi:oxygen-dependent protoporphyrinogen oxidase
MKVQVVVIGAGVAGLCAAYRLKEKGISTLVIEADKQVGGKIQSIRLENFTFDVGPNTVLDSNEAVMRLINDAGLSAKILWANSAANARYILKKNKLIALKNSPAILFTPLLSLPAKVRLFKEVFIAPSPVRETAAEFISRRFGKEVLDYLINPFLAGTFGAKPEHIAADEAFRTLTQWEKEHGSVIKGAWHALRQRKRAAKKSSRRMFSFAGGFYEVITQLAERLASNLWCEAHVQTLMRQNGTLQLSLTHAGHAQLIETKKVIVATPAPDAARLIKPIAPTLAAALEKVPYSPVAQVFLGYSTEQVHVPDAFGFLVPEVENRKILGAVFNSKIFPERYGDRLVITVFIGGSRQPELAQLPKEELIALARAELADILGIQTPPKAVATAQWHAAIPQYGLGHQEVRQAVEEHEQEHGDIFFTGNWRHGISVPDTIEHAEKIAEQVAASLHHETLASESTH